MADLSTSQLGAITRTGPSLVTRRLTIALWCNAVWMAFVWSTRIRNAVGDPTYHGAVLAATVAMSSAFIAAGLVLAGIAVAGRTRPLGRIEPVVITAIAAIGSVVWVIRAIQISQDGRGAGFIGVHVTLAVISIALAVWMVQSLRRIVRPSVAAAG